MYKTDPFGNPDGARASISELNSMFITTAFSQTADFSIKLDDLLDKRVIVGAKGSGKTIYLRKMQAMLNDKSEKSGIYVDENIEQNLNCTDNVVRVCDFFSKNLLSEKWTQLWKTAIRVSLGLKYVHDDRLVKYITTDEVAYIRETLKSQNLMFDVALSVYSVFKILLLYHQTANSVTALIESTKWYGMTDLLKRLLRKSPEIYMFLDSIDIEYEHAPMHWLTCQKGLFYAIMDMLQERILGEKLHIIMSMRSNVFASVLRSEHSTKFSNESHIFFLKWNFSNMRYFLREKVRTLGECYFVDKSSIEERGRTITTWFGTEYVHNMKRNIDEKIENYLVRHTRLVPRDVIILCNKLSVVNRLKTNDPKLDIHEHIRVCVAESSKTFGEELLTSCAKNIISNQMPNGAGRYEYSSVYTARDAYQEGSYMRLKRYLECLSSDRVSIDELIHIQDGFNKEINGESYLLDVLWQNGAIGYIDSSGKVKYYVQSADIDPLIPTNKDAYVLRSCLIDALSLTKYSEFPEFFGE